MMAKDWMPHVTALVAMAGFVFSIYQYTDTRRFEENNRRFDQFHRVFEWVGGMTADGTRLVDTQQAVAVYELSRFPEYRELTLPIIEYYLGVTATVPDDSLFRAALLYTREELSD